MNKTNSWKRTRYVEYDRINSLLDTALRDIEIRAIYHGLNFSELGYEEKINYLAHNYYTSFKTIEAVIRKQQ